MTDPVPANRVRETTTTTGTGAKALGGAVSGYFAFSDKFADNDPFYCAMVGGAQWQIGLAHTLSGNLIFDSIEDSSNGGSPVNFSAGVKRLFVTFTAQALIDLMADIAAAVPGGSSGQLQFNNAGAFGGIAGLTYSTSTKGLTIAPTSPTDHPLALTAGTLPANKNALYLTATHNNSTNNVGVLRVDATGGTANVDYHGLFVFTTSASQSNSSSAQVGIQSSLIGSYTGTSQTIAVGGDNTNAGTGTNPIGGSFRSNFGAKLSATGTTVGTNVGAYGKAINGDINIGLLGHGNVDKASKPTVGVLGGVKNATGPQIGGLFAINVDTSLPALTTSAALIADNGTATDAIFVARDSGSPVFSVLDGGFVEMAEVSTPGTPTSGFGRLYVKSSDSKIYFKSDGGTEYDLTSSGGGTPGGSNTQIQYNNAGSFGGIAGLTYNNSTEAIAISPSAATDHVLTITGGTLTSAKRALNLTATLQDSVTPQKAIEYVASVSSGTSATQLIGLLGTLSGSSSAPAFSTAAYFVNTATTVGTLPMGNNNVGNFGAFGSATSLVAGTNIGLKGFGGSSTGDNIGVAGSADGSSANQAIGVLGQAYRVSGTAARTGGMFTLGAVSNVPLFGISSALVAHNSTIAANIFTAFDDSSQVFAILDGGSVEMAEISAPSTPSSGFGRVYIKSSDSKLYFKNDAGTEYDLTAAAGGSVAGSDTQIQFNDGGSFGADSALTWNKTTDSLGIGGAATARISVSGANSADAITVKNTNTSGNAYFIAYNDSDNYIALRARGSSTAGTAFGPDGVTGANAMWLEATAPAGMVIRQSSNAPLVFVTNDLARGRIAGDGNWTIGSTTATSMFNVGTAAQFQVASTGVLTSTATGISTFGTTAFSIDPTNVRIGVGTATPSFPVDVTGSAGSLIARVKNTNSSNNAYVLTYNDTDEYFGLRLRGSATASTGFGGIANANMAILEAASGTSALVIRESANAPIVFVTNDTARGRFAAGGEFQLVEMTAPSTPASGFGSIYVKSSDSKLYFKNDGGTEYDLTGGGGGGGTPGGSDTQIQFNNGGSFGGIAGLTYSTSTKGLVISPSSPSEHPLLITGGTLPTSKNAVYITATHNNGTNNTGIVRIDGTFGTADTDYHGLYVQSQTGSQSNSNSGQVGIQSSILSGYTGTSQTMAYGGVNVVAGTGTNPIGGSFRSNFGGQFITAGTTTGTNVGVYGKAYNGDINISLLGHANVDKSSKPTVGVLGGVQNTAGPQIGGLFAINVNTSLPTLTTSAALIADNGSATDAIFLARDNGSEVFSVIDGGSVQMAEISAPGTPSSGFGRLYVKSSDSKLYFKNDGGTEYDLTATVGTPGGADTQIQFNDTGVLGGIAGFTYTSSTKALTIAPSSPTGNVLTITGGTLATTKRALALSATLANPGSTTENGLEFAITSAGSNNSTLQGLRLDLTAGYAGSGSTFGASFVNLTAGTASNVASGVGNFALQGATLTATAGANVGLFGQARNSTSLSIGVAGVTNIDATGANVAMEALSSNTTGVEVGGFFGIGFTAGTNPTHVSAALVADSKTTNPIFLGRDNGITVFTIADGGDTTLAPVSGHAGHVLTITGGSMASTKYALELSATLSTTANLQAGADFDVTTAGSASGSKVGILGTLRAGYTGTASTYGILISNAVGSASVGSVIGTGDIGVRASSTATSSGDNGGLHGSASGSSSVNVGTGGQASGASSSTAIGVYGTASASGGTPVIVGGMFTLYGATSTINEVSGALVASNATTTKPIFVARDDSTTVFTIEDSGVTLVSPATSLDTGVGKTSGLWVIPPNLTTQTASTEVFDFAVGSPSVATIQYSTGSLTTARSSIFLHKKISFVGSSTVTNASTVAISGPPIAETNATFTRAIGLKIDGIDVSGAGSVTNAYGLHVTEPSGATNTAAALFNGSTTTTGNAQVGSLTTDVGGVIIEGNERVHAGQRAYKSATETITSSTTLQDDDELSVLLSASTKYRFKFVIYAQHASSGAGGDFKWNIGSGSTASVAYTVYKEVYTVTTSASPQTNNLRTSLNNTENISLGTTNNIYEIVVEGSIETNVAGDGTLALQWAQNSSNSNSTKVLRGSYLEVTMATM